jgi:hypothetical protein
VAARDSSTPHKNKNKPLVEQARPVTYPLSTVARTTTSWFRYSPRATLAMASDTLAIAAPIRCGMSCTRGTQASIVQDFGLREYGSKVQSDSQCANFSRKKNMPRTL